MDVITEMLLEQFIRDGLVILDETTNKPVLTELGIQRMKENGSMRE